jgi:hypothetical protein
MEDEVQCPCCRLFYRMVTVEQYAPYKAQEHSPLHPRRGVCRDCLNHQGEGYAVKKARAQHHFAMLRREYATARERMVEARREVRDMEHELAMRPVVTRVRVENLDKIIVDEALKDRDEAYRRRDVAMGALSDIRRIHHKNPDNREHCICGKVYKQCEIAWIADRWDGVLAWERSQAGRAYRGERHYLEYDHPALKDRDYFRDVYGT